MVQKIKDLEAGTLQRCIAKSGEGFEERRTIYAKERVTIEDGGYLDRLMQQIVEMKSRLDEDSRFFTRTQGITFELCAVRLETEQERDERLALLLDEVVREERLEYERLKKKFG
jgi:hypothetical protein